MNSLEMRMRADNIRRLGQQLEGDELHNTGEADHVQDAYQGEFWELVNGIVETYKPGFGTNDPPLNDAERELYLYARGVQLGAELDSLNLGFLDTDLYLDWETMEALPRILELVAQL